MNKNELLRKMYHRACFVQKPKTVPNLRSVRIATQRVEKDQSFFALSSSLSTSRTRLCASVFQQY